VSQLVAARGGVSLMPELGYAPVNQYLPPRPRRAHEGDVPADPRPARDALADDAPTLAESLDPAQLNPLLRWLDRALSR
jgi:hypothetical protein